VAEASPATTVMVPVRGELEVLAVTEAVIEALVAQVEGVTDNHAWSDEADHGGWFVDTATVFWPAAEPADHDVLSNPTLACPGW